MVTLFVSDLHLDDARPQIVEDFERFCAGEARTADALYVLGDLFEAYIGDDDDAALNARIAHALHGVADAGVLVHFIVGNRDFLLGDAYACRCGMDLLDDGAVVDLYGTPTLILHGDVLCTDDAAYLGFRRQVRDPAWQAAFLARPLAERRAFAAQARDASRAHTSTTDMAIMDVNPHAVESALRQAGVARMIHGHTHRPAIHDITLDGKPTQRIVLGDWYEQGSVLRVTPDKAELRGLAA
ncbi:MAG: UDP-2,3-diacylglucosamine diphosphatase [Xanthomonadaceae bacterium]|nr:UDP-2,3-diacylglucosamine diphosphatase [Xanthomonadaceae bacterium]MBU6476515.1 UDP-2,3-diacylglucosamine diphosphatase [Xanthomonadaceae bacterium]MDE2053696.1 UDP-2,3-diacylglucosamine diphosphatase [Xanthomonadaceae bacterium]MDE2223698.1 UDP-2,3-diacylglucosamine diphosphatase [Xanthomonadaceae bacterium]MDE2497365.1 UDP-2,3-diacylglucosamine diphosphatase [Xanthomonadaceae bacterium]